MHYSLLVKNYNENIREEKFQEKPLGPVYTVIGKRMVHSWS